MGGWGLLSGSVETAQSLCQTFASLVGEIKKILRPIFKVQHILTKAEPPGKTTVERVEEKEEHPCDDDTVVDTYETVDDET